MENYQIKNKLHQNTYAEILHNTPTYNFSQRKSMKRGLWAGGGKINHMETNTRLCHMEQTLLKDFGFSMVYKKVWRELILSIIYPGLRGF